MLFTAGKNKGQRHGKKISTVFSQGFLTSVNNLTVKSTYPLDPMYLLPILKTLNSTCGFNIIVCMHKLSHDVSDLFSVFFSPCRAI